MTFVPNHKNSITKLCNLIIRGCTWCILSITVMLNMERKIKRNSNIKEIN